MFHRAVLMVPRHLRHRGDVRRDAADRLERCPDSLEAGAGQRGRRRVHRPLGGGHVDARCVELDVHAAVHVESPRPCTHARPVRCVLVCPRLKSLGLIHAPQVR